MIDWKRCLDLDIWIKSEDKNSAIIPLILENSFSNFWKYNIIVLYFFESKGIYVNYITYSYNYVISKLTNEITLDRLKLKTYCQKETI